MKRKEQTDIEGDVDINKLEEAILDLWIGRLDHEMKNPKNFQEWYENDSPEHVRRYGNFFDFLKHAYHHELACCCYRGNAEEIKKTVETIEKMFGEVDVNLRDEKIQSLSFELREYREKLEHLGEMLNSIYRDNGRQE